MFRKELKTDKQTMPTSNFGFEKVFEDINDNEKVEKSNQILSHLY
jgi:hypothetical protein